MSVELDKLVTAAEKACNEGKQGDGAGVERAVDALKVLKNTPITVALLTDTSAGKRIKKLTKHSNTSIAEAAKTVVAAWKTMVDQEKQPGDNRKSASSVLRHMDSTASLPSGAGVPTISGDHSTAAHSDAAQSSQPSLPTASSQIHPPQPTGDPKRDKARSLLADALRAALHDVGGADVGQVAGDVERAALEQAGGEAYLSKIRSLKFNLAKPDNPDLRRDVLSGRITAERLVTMSAEEMAPEKLKEEFKAIRDKMMFEVQRGGQQKATTDQFQCGKCRKRETTFYQLQTRSADEPMTTFVTCVNCGNRWKFC